MDLLTHLRAFRTVAEQRSFTRAAGELGVPQPVVSRRVAALEKHLGGRLLVRDPRGVGLSDLGRAVLPLARDLQVRTDQLIDVARTHEAGLTVLVPAGARPQALVAARTAAAGSGLRLGFATAGPAERRAALSDAGAFAALLACAVDEAEVLGELGAGCRDGHGVRLHLDSLRPGRRGPSGPGGPRARRVHVGVEDDVPWVRDVVRRHAGRVGLSPAQVVVGEAALTAAADVLEHEDVALCTATEAHDLGLAWRPVVGPSLVRGYRLQTGRPGSAHLPGPARRRLAADLAVALGLRDAASPDRAR